MTVYPAERFLCIVMKILPAFTFVTRVQILVYVTLVARCGGGPCNCMMGNYP